MTKTWVGDAEEIFFCAPGHILFSCVTNSARSQLAEGIAPSGVSVALMRLTY
ncbi:MAG: hypothetical protein ABGY10_07600 [bacterium]